MFEFSINKLILIYMDKLINWVKDNIILVAGAVAVYFFFIKKK